MKPVDMRLPKDKAKAMNAPVADTSAGNGQKYPWGLRLRLENESLDKLDIKVLPEPDTECRLMCVAKVVSVEKREQSGGEARRHLELQITKMALVLDDEESFSRGFSKGPNRSKGY